MKIINLLAGEPLAKKQDKVTEWYLIQSGAIEQSFGHAQIILEQNAIIGILESEWFSYDYIAKEDTALIVIPCKNARDLQELLAEHKPNQLEVLVDKESQLLAELDNVRKRINDLQE